MEVDIIHNEHVLDALKKIPDDCIDTIITSPPYWGLRDYGEETNTIWDENPNCKHEWEIQLKKDPMDRGKTGTHDAPRDRKGVKHGKKWEMKGFKSGFCQKCGAWYGQLGLEPTLDMYIEHLLQVTKELKRVLKPTGVMFWNHGDCYNNGDMQQQNEILVYKMRKEQGWRLANRIIWYKPNHMPSSVKKRFSNAYEPVYLLFKAKRPKDIWFDLDAVRVPYRPTTIERKRYPVTKIGASKDNPMGRFGKGIKQGNEGVLLANNPLGKNPGDIWKIPLSQKYLEGTGHSNRQGLNRPLDIVTIKAYKEYQQPIVKFLKKHIKPKHKPILDKKFGQHKWRHWIRTDYSGAALPGVKDWFKLKEILGFDNTFDDKIYEVKKLNIPIFQSGRNLGDVWKIATQPFPEAHFATFPEKLVEPMIRCACPKWICRACGKPRVRITESKRKIDKSKRSWEKGTLRNYKGERWSVESYQTIGWTDCGCGEKFDAGIILDPFAGAGTTLVVAKKLGRHYIGFEINSKYCEIAEKRLRSAVCQEEFDF